MASIPAHARCVPLFRDHQHYIEWVEEQMSTGAMRNERHLWTSVRPNGPRRPTTSTGWNCDL